MSLGLFLAIARLTLCFMRKSFLGPLSFVVSNCDGLFNPIGKIVVDIGIDVLAVNVRRIVRFDH
jgi:hypothetical protein